MKFFLKNFLGICADLLGRKRALLSVAIPFMMSWVILAVANSVYLLYIGRIISGFCNGWGMTLLPMYIGEIATVRYSVSSKIFNLLKKNYLLIIARS